MKSVSRRLSIGVATLACALGAGIVGCSPVEETYGRGKDDVRLNDGVSSVSAGTLPSATTSAIQEKQGEPRRGSTVCAKEHKAPQPLPVDLFIVMDTSSSLTYEQDLWTPLKSSVLSFLDDPKSNGLRVGLQFFPLRQGNSYVCDSATYAVPAVELAPLPSAVPALEQAIVQHADPWGATPMLTALRGAVSYLDNVMQKNPDSKTSILLVTDGFPNGKNCSNDTDQVAVVAEYLKQVRTGLDGDGNHLTHGISTFVIGLGELEDLNQLATAGGTQRAHLIRTKDANVSHDLSQALANVRQNNSQCEYKLPVPTNDEITSVDVRYTTANTASRSVEYVAGLSACTAAGGWFYDVAPAAGVVPTKLTLCPATCEQAKVEAASVDVAFLCASPDGASSGALLR